MRRIKVRTLLLLIVPLAIGLCFVEVDHKGYYGYVTFQPGLEWWWDSVSPSGEQSGFAITNGMKRLLSIEEFNGGVFVNANYFKFDPEHMKSGFWLKGPSPAATSPPDSIPIEIMDDQPPGGSALPDVPAPPLEPRR